MWIYNQYKCFREALASWKMAISSDRASATDDQNVTKEKRKTTGLSIIRNKTLTKHTGEREGLSLTLKMFPNKTRT